MATSDSQPPICADCRYFKRDTLDDKHKCLRKARAKTDSVDGQTITVGISHCRFQRSWGILMSLICGDCGKRGRFFEPRDSSPKPTEVK